MADGDALSAISAAYDTIEDAFPDAYAAASADDKPKVQAARNAARDAKDAALEKTLDDSDPQVATLTTALQAANDKMTSDLDGLKQVAQFIDLATKAANLAAQLAKLAA